MSVVAGSVDLEVMRLRSATFLCSVCGMPAATIRTSRPGEPQGTGWLLGQMTADRNGVTVSGLSGEHWELVEDPERFEVLEAILALQPPDPHRLHAEFSRLARFYCHHCRAVYCRDHWKAFTVFDPDMGSPDWTEGECPRGHVTLLDD